MHNIHLLWEANLFMGGQCPTVEWIAELCGALVKAIPK